LGEIYFLIEDLLRNIWASRAPRNPEAFPIEANDYTAMWIIDLGRDKAPPAPKSCAAVAQFVTEGLTVIEEYHQPSY